MIKMSTVETIEEVIKTGLIKEKEYDKIMNPLKMTKPK